MAVFGGAFSLVEGCFRRFPHPNRSAYCTTFSNFLKRSKQQEPACLTTSSSSAARIPSLVNVARYCAVHNQRDRKSSAFGPFSISHFVFLIPHKSCKYGLHSLHGIVKFNSRYLFWRHTHTHKPLRPATSKMDASGCHFSAHSSFGH